MSSSNGPLFKIGFQIFWVLPAAAIATIATAALYQLVVIKNPYGIVNPIVYIAMVFAIAATIIFSIRLAKVRGKVPAFLFGSGIAVLFVATSLFVAHRLHPAGHASGNTIPQFFSEYRKQGISLFGGTAAVRGGWLVTIWVLGTTGIGLLGVFISMVEASAPFCEQCKKWARKEVWRFSLHNPTDQSLAVIRKERAISSTLRADSGGPLNRTLDYSVRACDCGKIATLDLRIRRGDSEGEIVVDKLWLNPFTLTQVLEFGERHDSRLIGMRPALSVASESAVPFDTTPKPDGAEYRSFVRLETKLGASDSYVDNEYTKAIRKRLQLGDYRVAQAALNAQRNRSDFAYVAEACADWDNRPEWLTHWISQDPDGSHPLLIHAINTIKLGWQRRGVGFTPKNVFEFWNSLEEAKPQLIKSAEASPHDATPWAWLIYQATGIEDSVETAQGYFREAIRRHPTSRIAHSFMIQRLSPKWGGSREEMMAFARTSSAGLPSGKHVHIIVVEAHLEVAGEIHRDQSRRASLDYWRSPGVAEELRTINNKCFKAASFKPNMDTPRTRAYLAYALWKSGQTEEAAEHLRVIGKSSPWGPFQPNLPFMKDSVRRARKACKVR